MFLFHQRSNHWQFPQYFHFAEPYPRGVIAAYANSVLPDDELAAAAEGLRTAEVESARGDERDATGSDSHLAERPADDAELRISPDRGLDALKLTQAQLESMSIDKVRAVANVLDVPDRAAITEKSELIHEVLRRL